MQDILLPEPVRTGGMPLCEAIASRRSSREFSDRRFNLQAGADLQLLSDLLWAGFGQISPRRRSAPSSHNRQETSLYVLLPEGCFLYDAESNRLVALSGDDLRAASGLQDYVGSAAAEIAFVADTSKITGKTERGLIETIYVDTGFISQNIYLFCASAGLASVVRAMVPKADLATRMNLAPTQEITLVQSVGWRKNVQLPE